MEQYQSRWARIWAIWLGVVAVSFAILEGIALVKRKDGDTLSENTRTWIGTDKTWKTKGALGFVVALVAFCIWFIPHIVWKTW